LANFIDELLDDCQNFSEKKDFISFFPEIPSILRIKYLEILAPFRAKIEIKPLIRCFISYVCYEINAFDACVAILAELWEILILTTATVKRENFKHIKARDSMKNQRISFIR
jgi:hypothetical protein